MSPTRIRAASLLTLLVSLVAQPALAQQSSSPGLQDKVKNLFSNPKEDELLEPDLAFQLKVTAKGTNVLIADVAPANGYYVYKERTRFTIKNGSGVSIKAVKFPAGEMKVDQIFGRTEVFKKTFPVEITLDNATKGKNITVVASYQGCHEKLGVCYPPIEKSVNLVLP